MVLGETDSALPIRDASTIILVRDAVRSPRILMGQRGKTAAFMPDKFVFPGGAVDKADALVDVPGLNQTCETRLRQHAPDASPKRFATAAIRELWEETGQCLGKPASWNAPEGWGGFEERGLAPDATPLHFFFRALTPPGRPRRFDARFFLADADALATDPDDFSEAEDELSHLHWVSMQDVRQLNLPFITRLVLAELEKHLPRIDAPEAVPFVKNDDMESQVIWMT
jgi:8-oxo-dGTP pyrophosphatase MutT (NUDIX family)